MYVCVSSVHCASQEWEISEYSDSLCIRCTRVNAACHIVLRECASPDLKPFQSLCLLNFEQLTFTSWPKDMSSVDMVWLFLAFYMLIPACVSPLLSNIFKNLSAPVCPNVVVYIICLCEEQTPFDNGVHFDNVLKPSVS